MYVDLLRQWLPYTIFISEMYTASNAIFFVILFRVDLVKISRIYFTYLWDVLLLLGILYLNRLKKKIKKT